MQPHNSGQTAPSDHAKPATHELNSRDPRGIIVSATGDQTGAEFRKEVLQGVVFCGERRLASACLWVQD
jgi:hypothetical protein